MTVADGVIDQVLFCRQCGQDLSLPVTVFSFSPNAPSRFVFEDAKPITKTGFAMETTVPMQLSTGSVGTKIPLDFTPQYWVNLADVLPSVQKTTNARRLNGCCGLDGCDGPNRVCSCGAEVGTEQSDCWTPLVFIPQPETTHWRNAVRADNDLQKPNQLINTGCA